MMAQSSNLLYFLNQVFMKIHLWDILESILSNSLELSSFLEALIPIFVVFSGNPNSPDLFLVWKSGILPVFVLSKEASSFPLPL